MNYRTLLIVNSFYIAITLPSVSSVGKPVRILDIVFSQTSLGGGSSISTPVGTLTSILISRFLIDLQKVKRRLEGSSRSLSELAFRSHASQDMDGFIGSFGAQLPFFDDQFNEDEDQP
ncbi:hypothetical protein BD309DRAFT_961413 [Dichomitus squalens]|nr:hypothetical protein BD309DRAFT_961413 [Dichomitus squalens]